MAKNNNNNNKQGAENTDKVIPAEEISDEELEALTNPEGNLADEDKINENADGNEDKNEGETLDGLDPVPNDSDLPLDIVDSEPELKYALTTDASVANEGNEVVPTPSDVAPIDPDIEPIEPVDPIDPVSQADAEIKYGFTKTDILAILDEKVVIDESVVSIKNTEDDIIALDKVKKIYYAAKDAGNPDNASVCKVLSQMVAFAETQSTVRNSEALWSTIIREINASEPGTNFDLLMFILIRTFIKLRVFGELQIIKSLRECKNAELKQAALAMSHVIKELSNAEQRKEKVDVTISLARVFTVSPSGFKDSAVTMLKDYFNKK